MQRDIHGRTRTQWASQWALWWSVVAIAAFLAFQLSRPVWDAPKLIADKKASCEAKGMVMVQERVKFGTNYFCKEL